MRLSNIMSDFAQIIQLKQRNNNVQITAEKKGRQSMENKRKKQQQQKTETMSRMIFLKIT